MTAADGGPQASAIPCYAFVHPNLVAKGGCSMRGEGSDYINSHEPADIAAHTAQ
jgi:hypothetical protein